jgi:hypothetical protein
MRPVCKGSLWSGRSGRCVGVTDDRSRWQDEFVGQLVELMPSLEIWVQLTAKKCRVPGLYTLKPV